MLSISLAIFKHKWEGESKVQYDNKDDWLCIQLSLIAIKIFTKDSDNFLWYAVFKCDFLGSHYM